MIGHSSALAGALDQVSRLAGINRPVLVLGERGTGKELAAERLHYLSGRWDAPLPAKARKCRAWMGRRLGLSRPAALARQ